MKKINKYFVVKTAKGCFCSKCNQKVLNDRYLILKHAKFCDVTFEYDKAINEEDVLTYNFEIKNNQLHFNVYNLNVTLSSVHEDKCVKSEWNLIFHAIFQRNSKNVIEEGKYNVDIWFKKMIEEDRLISLNNSEGIIKTYYKSIPFIYSLGDFLDIYRQKGFIYNKFDLEVLSKIPFDDSHIKSTGNVDIKYILYIKEHLIKDDVILECYIRNKENKKTDRIFVSKDFLYNETNFDLKQLFKKKIKKIEQTNYFSFVTTQIESIDKFNKKYPELLINRYLDDNGSNILIPLLSGNFNKEIELLSKSGLSILADNFAYIKCKNRYGNNLKEIFGFNINIIKFFNDYSNINLLNNIDFIETINNINNMQRNIWNTDLSTSALIFLFQNFGLDTYQRIPQFYEFNKNDWLSAVKLLNQNRDPLFAHLYSEYLNYSNTIDDFKYEKCPKNLEEAHDIAVDLYYSNLDKITNKKFKEALRDDKYRFLDSLAYLEDDKIHFYEDILDNYRIILPSTQVDLINESNTLNHCVKTYIHRVANKETYILFLRKANDLHTPFATIEITKDLKLIQLKAKNNQHVSIDAQEFVKEYAESKNIKISSYDFDI